MQQHSRLATTTTALLTGFLAVEEKLHNSNKILNRSKFFFEDFPTFKNFKFRFHVLGNQNAIKNTDEQGELLLPQNADDVRDSIELRASVASAASLY